MIIAYIVLDLLCTLSIILLTGHGSFLIAGYNTSSPEEKAKYDAKKLCRAVGVMLLLIAAATAGLLFISFDSIYSTLYFIFFFIFIFADIGVTLYYTNKRCLKKDHEVNETNGAIDDEYLRNNQTSTKKKKPTPLVVGICLTILPVILLVSIVLYQASQPPVFTVSGDALKISSAFGETIRLSDIKSMQIQDSLPKDLGKINGSDFGSILKGRFKTNGKNVEIFLDAAKPPFLYIKTTGGLTILSDQSRAKTEALYNQLKSESNMSANNIVVIPMNKNVTKGIDIGFWIFMLIINLLMPAIMIVFGSICLKRAPKEINDVIGYRTTMSMKNRDTWEFAHHYCGKVWHLVGWVILVPSILATVFVFGKDTSTVGSLSLIVIVVQTIILIISIAPTEFALRKTFDENGYRR